ncbi:MAG: hypothetical protein J6I79_01680 [Paludibacteraceae bacterium]|nr:hypothetical protein [Paludibacteraceae bacterium]
MKNNVLDFQEQIDNLSFAVTLLDKIVINNSKCKIKSKNLMKVNAHSRELNHIRQDCEEELAYRLLHKLI